MAPMNNNPTDELIEKVRTPMQSAVNEALKIASRDYLYYPNDGEIEEIIDIIQQHDKQHYASKVREAGGKLLKDDGWDVDSSVHNSAIRKFLKATALIFTT